MFREKGKKKGSTVRLNLVTPCPCEQIKVKVFYYLKTLKVLRKYREIALFIQARGGLIHIRLLSFLWVIASFFANF